jgi:hypothetical protein
MGYTLAGRTGIVGREELLIEGFRPSDLPDALGPELEAEVSNGRPLVARVGTAEILARRHPEGSDLSTRGRKVRI